MSGAAVATKAEMDDLVASLRTIAERAGEEILRYYVDEKAMEIQQKADQSPLTAADLAADALIVKALEELTPDIPVVSEERVDDGQMPQVGRRFWLVDPLDGTKEFISRNGEFTVNIALVESGEPIAGVVHAPALAMTWVGARAGDSTTEATYSETGRPSEAIAVRPAPPEGLAVVASRRHGNLEKLEAFLGGHRIAETRNAGSSIKFCLVASGKADVYPRFGRTMEWDTAAGHAVLAAAGGRVETVEGAPLTYGKSGFENPEFVAYGGI